MIARTAAILALTTPLAAAEVNGDHAFLNSLASDWASQGSIIISKNGITRLTALGKRESHLSIDEAIRAIELQNPQTFAYPIVVSPSQDLDVISDEILSSISRKGGVIRAYLFLRPEGHAGIKPLKIINALKAP